MGIENRRFTQSTDHLFLPEQICVSPWLGHALKGHANRIYALLGILPVWVEMSLGSGTQSSSSANMIKGKTHTHRKQTSGYQRGREGRDKLGAWD